MNPRIITDSSANVTSPEILGVDHKVAPLSLEIDGKIWQDDPNIDMDQFLSALKETNQKANSSCPNIDSWLKTFEGSDEIFVITITSALSGSYNAASQAARIFHEDHPEAKILVFDSRSAGPQLQLLAQRIAQLINKGFSFEEIVKEAENYQHHIGLVFTLQDLTNLANNGRVTPAVARIAQVLRLNVIGTANNKGEFELLGRARGPKRARANMLKDMIKKGYIGGRVQIDHVQNLEGAEEFKKTILEKFPDAEVNIGECGALCSFYAENGGLMVGYEK